MVSAIEQHLERTSPESQGITSSAILQFVEALDKIQEVHSFMLLRHGKVLAEVWWSPYHAESPHLIFSLSKSYTSTALGLAVTEGLLSLDDAVLSFFPDEKPLEMSDLWSGLRVRHLLSMSTGQAFDTWSAMVDRPDGNWIKGFFSVPLVHPAGTHFVYNTGATYMLSAILQKTTGMTLLDYLQPRLFAPLGIENATWQESPQGITAGGIGLKIKTEDIAKFGQLYLQKGRWQGEQILPEAWVEEATAAQVSNSHSGQLDWAQGYGYQFWMCRHGAYRGDGVFGQYCIVMPEQDAVLAITAGIDVFDMQQPLNLVWDILLPAMSNQALPENGIAHAALLKKLSILRFMPMQGQANSPLAAQISGRAYTVESNELGLEALTFNFTENDSVLHLQTKQGDENIPFAYGRWQGGETQALFSQALLFDDTPIMSSGAWSDEDTFILLVRLYETPFYYTFACHFMGDELLLELRINVSLESMKPIVLLAQVM